MSSDLGLPAPGVPLDGLIRVQAGHARVLVFTSPGILLFLGALHGAGISVLLVMVALQPSAWKVLFLLVWLATSGLACHSFRSASRKVAQDAVSALRGMITDTGLGSP